jgi:hypothetical protein
MNNWHRIQTMRQWRFGRNHQPRIIRHNNRNRRGTMDASSSNQDSVDSNHSCYKFTNGKTVWGNGPEAIDERSIYRHYGGYIYVLKPLGQQPYMISGIKNLRQLQVGGISPIETNVEWKKYDYRENTEKLLRKTFGDTRISYSTSDE